MRNAVAIKFDTWYNWDKYDPGFFHVAVHAGSVTNGATTVAPEALGLAYDFADLNDGEYHEALIEYSPHFDDADAGNVSDIHTLSMMPAVAARLPTAQRGGLRYLGMLTVHLDGKRILRVPINLEEVITLDSGKAYVGFTGATGSASKSTRSSTGASTRARRARLTSRPTCTVATPFPRSGTRRDTLTAPSGTARPSSRRSSPSAARPA